jgi:rubrerythrin
MFEADIMNQTQKPADTKLPSESLKALDICQYIHKHAEEFYQYLARIHGEDPEIARIWGLMAVDKCNHSDTFKMASRLKGEGISKIYISSEKATSILNKMKLILSRASQNPPSILEALRFSIKMEENLNCVNFCHVVKFINEQDMVLYTSQLKSSLRIAHMMIEEYVNLTILEQVPVSVREAGNDH